MTWFFALFNCYCFYYGLTWFGVDFCVQPRTSKANQSVKKYICICRFIQEIEKLTLLQFANNKLLFHHLITLAISLKKMWLADEILYENSVLPFCYVWSFIVNLSPVHFIKYIYVKENLRRSREGEGFIVIQFKLLCV